MPNEQQEQMINTQEILEAFEVMQNEAEKYGKVANVLGKCATLVNSLLEQQQKLQQEQQNAQQNEQGNLEVPTQPKKPLHQ